MARSIDVLQAQRLVVNRAELRHLGVTPRELARRESEGELIRLHRSWVVDAESWRDLWPEGRHLLSVVAAVREMEGGALVVSHESAAALWGLPLYRHPYGRPHATALGSVRTTTSHRLIRHNDRLTEADVTAVDGIRCTTLERTVFDLARTVSMESAVSAADAALGRASVVDRVPDEEQVILWRDRMRSRIAEAGPVRGVAQARWALGFADGRAELPGESVTRLQLYRLGFPPPRLQIPVRSPHGGTWWVDLGLDEAEALLEFDGQGKYLDEAMRSGRTLDEVLLAEKRREDWIRGVTGRRFIRAEDVHIRTPVDLGRRLASFGVHPPR